MKKIFVCSILFLLSYSASYGVDFDSSIDAQIRKDYNINESDLPPLPTEEPTYTKEIQTPKYNPLGAKFTIKRSEKIQLQLLNNISDRSKKGSKVSFKAIKGIMTKEGQIIPQGTIFKGTITDSHPPQISGNGGLVELKIDEIYFNGIMSPIMTKVSLAGSRKVFLGNIKGKRTYWNNFSKVMKPGKKTFSSCQKCASVMSTIPVINLISFVPYLGGTVIYSINAVIAPVVTLFTKGKSLSIPQGTVFEIKMIDNCKISG